MEKKSDHSDWRKHIAWVVPATFSGIASICPVLEKSGITKDVSSYDEKGVLQIESKWNPHHPIVQIFQKTNEGISNIPEFPIKNGNGEELRKRYLENLGISHQVSF